MVDILPRHGSRERPFLHQYIFQTAATADLACGPLVTVVVAATGGNSIVGLVSVSSTENVPRNGCIILQGIHKPCVLDERRGGGPSEITQDNFVCENTEGRPPPASPRWDNAELAISYAALLQVRLQLSPHPPPVLPDVADGAPEFEHALSKRKTGRYVCTFTTHMQVRRAATNQTKQNTHTQQQKTNSKEPGQQGQQPANVQTLASRIAGSLLRIHIFSRNRGQAYAPFGTDFTPGIYLFSFRRAHATPVRPAFSGGRFNTAVHHQ